MIFAQAQLDLKREARGRGDFGQSPSEDVVRDCQLELGFPEATCRELLTVAENNPEIAYTLARAALTKTGAVACAKSLSSEGVPPHLSKKMCDWAAENLWDFLFEYLPRQGAPTWRGMQVGRENVHWRRCPSPAGLQPGEHWVPPEATQQWAVDPVVEGACVPNVAILFQEGQIPKAVYIPCEHLPRVGPYAGGVLRYCRDKDGMQRVVGTRRDRPDLPTFWPGLYGKRLDVFPKAYEAAPWVPPMVSPSVPGAVTSVSPGATQFVSVIPSGTVPSLFPSDAVAVFDSSIGQFRILVPS